MVGQVLGRLDVQLRTSGITKRIAQTCGYLSTCVLALFASPPIPATKCLQPRSGRAVGHSIQFEPFQVSDVRRGEQGEHGGRRALDAQRRERRQARPAEQRRAQVNRGAGFGIGSAIGILGNIPRKRLRTAPHLWQVSFPNRFARSCWETSRWPKRS